MSQTGQDPYTLEIIKTALVAVGDEMFAALRRASMSPVIYEALDYSTGVTSASGDLIAQGNGTTVFLGMMDSLVRQVLSKFGDDIHPGDVFFSNDPYVGGGTHLSDMALAKPIFFGEALIAFAVNKAHWVDVGGMAAGSFTTDSREIFQEGLQIPTVKVVDRGKPVQAVLDILEANIRFPDASMGDFWAGNSANNVAEKRIVELAGKYGLETVQTAMRDLLDYGERMMHAELAKLPQGVFHAEDWIDDDGVSDEPLRVCVRVEITPDRFVADFTGSAPQALGPINNSRTGLISAVRTVFKALTNPSIPANGGAFRALEVICPDRTVFTCERPAPVSTYWETMLYAEDLVWRALADKVPERLTAGHLLSVCAIILSSRHADTGEDTLLVGPLAGGWGAMSNRDGLNGQFSVADGETYNFPVEITEARYGMMVERYAFHDEDGGAGEHRGGKGLELRYRVRAKEALFTGSFGRFKFPPWGVGGGLEGSRSYAEVMRGGQHAETPEVYGKPARVKLIQGDVVRIVTATGGGWGDPGRRSAEALADDLKNGFVKPQQVERYYAPGAGRAAS